MMTQGEFMEVQVLRAAGWTIRQIAAHVGCHPATVSAWLKAGGPPAKRESDPEVWLIDERWQERIAGLLAHNPALRATSMMRVLGPEGFPASYPTLTRYLRTVRGRSRGAVPGVAVPIETGPGEEFQFDWSDCNLWARRWGWDHELHCFGTVLCWSRRKRWWFATAIDRAHTMEGLAGWFDDLGGIPAVGRTDRMGQLGTSRGRSFRWAPVVFEFARHYGLALKVCRAGDAARKGKVERPFRDLKSGFLAEMDLDPPADVAELNRRAEAWLAEHAHAVVHRTTKQTPEERFAIEQPLLAVLPRVRFDTAQREPRRVGKFPLVEWDGVFYSVSPDAVNHLVEARQPVTEPTLEVRLAGRVVAVHRLAAAGSQPQWLPEHRAAAEAIALGRHGRHLRAVHDHDVPADVVPVLLELGDGDYDVAEPDLDLLGSIGPHPDDHPDPDRGADGHTAPGFFGCECFGGGR